jgi:hypothetical protein
VSDSDDILGKADAFLKRYHPSSASGRDDVPVLTEVIAEPSAAPAQPPDTPAQGGPARTEMLDLERRLKQSILDAISLHLTKSVEDKLRTRLDAHLQHALTALNTQVKADIEPLIREAVARAVEAEIKRVRGPSRGA